MGVTYRVDRIIEARIKRGWTQTHLAKVIGKSPQAIHAIESGRFNGLPATIKSIADALGLSMDDLMSKKDEEQLTA